ncbi:hypothetical protein ROZALSC1DRAFT_28920 [Rozella allomycis CSF55]|uniref:Uncharacterized protein n=1 Tax=Rozella allomycis (strain CSF55) TaxID=988480 RepID=A0A075AWU9_ROZAC|nr:hypothetical protein O9G_005030 [Rozella allomycis CSF55]RKP19487.1 hypothetical protein ROZALSC1DRAFT_28917 [Rozella allomycis CSF55]RKP19490.1 hypothetical protein ROZALSC1DRAFT_28920 [Rozella allomycis CSF55]|eukprot:EPZ33034.1 hypothetical protein O9G_005030 [Rozella allomycis CSF55]
MGKTQKTVLKYPYHKIFESHKRKNVNINIINDYPNDILLGINSFFKNLDRCALCIVFESEIATSVIVPLVLACSANKISLLVLPDVSEIKLNQRDKIPSCIVSSCDESLTKWLKDFLNCHNVAPPILGCLDAIYEKTNSKLL